MPSHDSRLISVALSAYNGAGFLPAQLDSILRQREVDLEVIAVDDASSDDSLAVLEEYARSDARVRVHPNLRNLGPTRSFERAMSLCHGEFIAPSDQDDIWHPNKLRTLLEAIGNQDLAYCDSEYIDADGRLSGRLVSHGRRMQSGRKPLRFVFDNTVSGHAMLVRRSLFEAARPLPATLYYDWTLAMLAAARNGIVYVDEPLVRFRRHEQALSSMGGLVRGSTHRHDRYRRWFEDRTALLITLANSGLDADGQAARFAAVLAQAIDGTGRPLLRAIWHERDALSQQECAWLVAMRLQLRVLHKLNRARAEASS